jgi:glutamate-1-semialdehyde 2,1-aminomutase
MRDFTASRAYVSAVHTVIPGGAHTYAKGDDQYPAGMAPVIARGEGCRVWDIDGNEYVEFGSGLRANVLGHGFEPVLEQVRAALADGIGFVRPHARELEAATRLAELIPSAEMVKFGLNGSDATTAALRLARAYTGRDMIAICRDHPFFSTDDWFIGTTAMPAGIPDAARRLSARFSYNDLPSLARVFAEHPGQIAAVILEPETSTPPAPGFFAGLRDLCDRNGALLILDEMITGMRWHERGAQFMYDIEPDLSTFGKGLANGFPLSALTGRREVMRLGGFAEDADRVFLLSQTAGAQPWALAAMLAVIDTFERDQVAARLMQAGQELRAGIEEVVADAGLSAYFQVLGRDCNLVYAARDGEGQASQEFRTLVLQELLERGILAPSFVVSAAHDPAAIKQTVAAIADLMPVYRQALDHGIDTVLRGRPVRPAVRNRGLSPEGSARGRNASLAGLVREALGGPVHRPPRSAGERLGPAGVTGPRTIRSRPGLHQPQSAAARLRGALGPGPAGHLVRLGLGPARGDQPGQRCRRHWALRPAGHPDGAQADACPLP